MKENPVLAWHFCSTTLRNGAPIPPDGELLVYSGRAIMCESGLHASRHLRGALKYSPGNILCRVECFKVQEEDTDKLVCLERRILARIDAQDLLWKASRKYASDVLNLWRAPEIVKKFLLTGDPYLRSAAWSAAESAAWSAARSAAESAAWAAAESAAWSAAESAAWSAAAWSAARSAAWSAAESAAESAAWSAARSAAWSAAESAAESAARSAQNDWLEVEALKLMGREE